MSQLALRPLDDVKGWHAHVYFPGYPDLRAETLRRWISERFLLRINKTHQGPFGPHTTPSFNVIFDNQQFNTLIPWLVLNRLGLNVLLHPVTENGYLDHTGNALWLGARQTVSYGPESDAEFAAQRPPRQEQPLFELEPNTHPYLALEEDSPEASGWPAQPRSGRDIHSWQANLYASAEQLPRAEELRQALSRQFAVELGPLRPEAEGVHTRGGFSLRLQGSQLFELSAWFALNNNGFDIQIHANSDDPFFDVIQNGLWSGNFLAVNARGLPRSLKALGQRHPPVLANSQAAQAGA